MRNPICTSLRRSGASREQQYTSENRSFPSRQLAKRLSMISVDPYTQAHLTLSIEVNGFALAAPSVPGSLLRFVRPLAF